MSENRNTEEKIQEVYPHPFKLVKMADIEKAIEERNNDVIFLHLVGPAGTGPDARCYKILKGTRTVFAPRT